MKAKILWIKLEDALNYINAAGMENEDRSDEHTDAINTELQAIALGLKALPAKSTDDED